MSENKFTSEDVRGVLLAAGYSIDEIVKFMADVKNWFPVWTEFDKRAQELRSQGVKVGGMKILNDMRQDAQVKRDKTFKINNNDQPYFSAMFNGKHRTPYFETRAKHNKSKHHQSEAA